MSRIVAKKNKTQRTNLKNETAKIPNKQTTIGEMSRAIANILGPISISK